MDDPDLHLYWANCTNLRLFNLRTPCLDYEEIQINGTVLKITKFIGSKTKEYEFNSRWTQIVLPKNKPKIFILSSEKQNIELGQFVRQDQLPQIISEIKACLG